MGGDRHQVQGQIGASADVLPEGTQTLTRDSPLGRALVTAQPGDTITYSGTDGTVVADVIAIRPSGPTSEAS
jgi:transcription elongation GreA/GreB family factor